MNFKLKFHTSVATLLESYEAKARIQLELRDKKYIVKYVTDNSVSFKNRSGFRWSFSPANLDGGEFVISDSHQNERLLSLNYYYDYSPPLLIFAAFIIILLFQGEYGGIVFFAIFFGVTVPIDIALSKSKAGELLAAIVRVDG